MKILITAKNSYIGGSFYNWVKENNTSLIVDQISLRNINLQNLNLKEYDVILHVAGIAHITSNKKFDQEYYKVNRDLAIKIAFKAKENGVKQFIFISSMAIYGDDLPLGVYRPINIKNYNPKSAYAKSKLEADKIIESLNDLTFKTVILRIPMVYGPNSKGNFPRLEKFASNWK